MNKSRNRYANIQACESHCTKVAPIILILSPVDDHSRVKLQPIPEFPHDYINANFIHVRNYRST